MGSGKQYTELEYGMMYIRGIRIIKLKYVNNKDVFYIDLLFFYK